MATKKVPDAKIAFEVIEYINCKQDSIEIWYDLRDILLKVLYVIFNDDQDRAEQHLIYRYDAISNCIETMLSKAPLARANIDIENGKISKNFEKIEQKENLLKIQALSATEFEHYCAKLLIHFKFINSSVTGCKNDDGVDFIGDIMIGTQKCILMGQSKRYQSTNIVGENEIKKFIGGALRKKHDLIKEGKIGIMTPIFFAFWTTSFFHEDANNYATKMGIWLQNGYDLAENGFI